MPVTLPVALRRLRDGLDPSAAIGIAAHVTLLYPFVPPAALEDAVRDRVATIVAAEPAFSFVLRRVARWPRVVYLPPEPSEPFRRLIGSLADAFPDYPLYGGTIDLSSVVPHVTIAQSDRAADLDAAAHAVPALLPVRGVAREAWLIGHAAGEHWHTISRLPLAAHLGG